VVDVPARRAVRREPLGVPVTLKPQKFGFDFCYPTEWAGQDMQPDHPIRVKADGFNPEPTLAKDWSDWCITMLMADGTRSMTTTIGHGFPFAWTETANVTPRLEFDELVTFFDDAGKDAPSRRRATTSGSNITAAPTASSRRAAPILPDGQSITLHTPARSFS